MFSSLAQEPKSINLHFFEQKGLYLFSSDFEDGF